MGALDGKVIAVTGKPQVGRVVFKARGLALTGKVDFSSAATGIDRPAACESTRDVPVLNVKGDKL